MQCPGSEHDNKPAARFCESCGARLTRSCSSSGEEGGPQARFCPACGTTLAEPAAARPATHPETGPDVAAPPASAGS
jgi:adenylate cyclase